MTRMSRRRTADVAKVLLQNGVDVNMLMLRKC